MHTYRLRHLRPFLYRGRHRKGFHGRRLAYGTAAGLVWLTFAALGANALGVWSW